MPKSDFEIMLIERTVSPPPNDNNEYTTIYHVQVVRVPQLINYGSCLQCEARVEPLTSQLGKCTKDDCLMMQLFHLCNCTCLATPRN